VFQTIFNLIVALFLFSLLSFSTSASELTTEQKLSDFEQLVSSMKSGYGPLKYKEESRGISIDVLAKSYSEKIRETKSNGAFYYLIVKFVAEFKDSHFSASLPTSHRANLGFICDMVEGKILIADINRDRLPEEKFPFKRGDEIISMNGQPIDSALEALMPYISSGNLLTQKKMATFFLTSRQGSTLPVPTEKTAKFTISSNGNMVETEVEWILKGQYFDEYIAPKTDKSGHLRNSTAMDFGLVSVKDIWNSFRDESIEADYLCSGTTRIAIPENSTIIMKEPFVAYYHPTEKGNIGYLRIPDYMPVNPSTGDTEFDLRLAQYEYAVSILEKNTTGLIIDQDHNCGGSVSYLEAIVSLFMPTSFAPMQFQLLASKASYLTFLTWLNNSDQYTMEYGELQSVAEVVKRNWLDGNFLTFEKIALSGQLSIAPNNIRYTHPIVMLIDEHSGSGGDAFPSMLQGYGRAKLFGTRTMGAGGHVSSAPSLNFSGIRVMMTKSLFFRPDGVPVENNGAVPDYHYTITRNDFLNEYREYQKSYLQALFDLL